MPPRRRPLLLITAALLVGALALTVAVLLTGRGRSTSSGPPQQSNGSRDSVSGFAGAALPSAQPARAFALSDQQGRLLSLRTLRGQVVLLAFVSSACGRSCVLIAQQIRGALDELSRPVPALLISVDPAADTRASVERFLRAVSLSGRVRFLNGAPSALRALWRAYRVSPLSAGSAAFERSAQVMLIDRRGELRVLYGLEQLTPEALSHDIRKLAH